ncbi:protein kinase [Streptomyces asoensis]|uniref:serine/threonine-protein kinase n=1 Tax=Streptomyces asoensis TaxID=249586 RepID=UPI003710E397
MGEVFAGRYELADPIGRGGVGAVWRAWDHRRRRYVAAKVLQQRDAHALLRFVREQALRIDHPHVLAPASWAADDDKVLFTMDLVAGGSLVHLVGDYGPLPPGFVCTLLDQLLSGLTAVHAEGVVHRDIKPANILLEATGTARPRLRLSDFGIAMRLGEPRLTETNLVVGTPGYLAPEQMMGADPDFPADLFAVGLVALYLLEGAKPDAKALVQYFAEHGTPGAPKSVPEPLWQVVATLLQPDPQARFRTATGARKALAAAVELLPEPGPDDELIEIFDQLGPLPGGFGPDGPPRRRLPGTPGSRLPEPPGARPPHDQAFPGPPHDRAFPGAPSGQGFPGPPSGQGFSVPPPEAAADRPDDVIGQATPRAPHDPGLAHLPPGGGHPPGAFGQPAPRPPRPSGLPDAPGVPGSPGHTGTPSEAGHPADAGRPDGVRRATGAGPTGAPGHPDSAPRPTGTGATRDPRRPDAPPGPSGPGTGSLPARPDVAPRTVRPDTGALPSGPSVSAGAALEGRDDLPSRPDVTPTPFPSMSDTGSFHLPPPRPAEDATPSDATPSDVTPSRAAAPPPPAPRPPAYAPSPAPQGASPYEPTFVLPTRERPGERSSTASYTAQDPHAPHTPQPSHASQIPQAPQAFQASGVAPVPRAGRRGHRAARRVRPGPPAKVTLPLLLLALVCYAVGFWALTRI